MRKYNIPPAFSSSLQLGRQGENGVTEITFLCAGYAKMYGDGFAEAVHRTPDGTTYPVNIEQDENNRVSWLISDGDTATAGTGQLELRWMVNGNLAKSKIFSTIIKSALTAPETPPDAAKSWVDKVLKAAEDIKEGAIDDEKLAKAIAEYLENHPIESGITEQKAREIAQSVVDAYQESDPTVPDWAKAETKPTYTAAEVGAVPESAKNDIDKNTAARHTHGNKSTLDAITAEDIAKWNSGTAGTVEITGATGLAAGSAPTVTETADSTARARKYQLGIPAGKDGADGAKGDKGETGAKGDKGEQGADGKSAYQYAQDGGYTGNEAEFAAKLAQEKFANPNALTFTGAVTGSYDGSVPVSVEIPSGVSEAQSGFELIDSIDWSTEDMAQAGAAKEYTLNGVTEIIIVWQGMANETKTTSFLEVWLNDLRLTGCGTVPTSKAGSTLYGFSFYRCFEGVGTLVIRSPGANSVNPVATNAQIPYSLFDIAERISKLKINNSFSYVANTGITKIYVR